ncbi:hypothetical protein [Levilactobacillus fuyuanensis]|uniref:Uncharacterized protein n=1 Tax=Levilactobacillus fuyuanensis TaxID=2486022 RepID=A0ABW4H6E1_9LACO|nr:hypothetical protein [Levilactobacillus fuyuanensis]
MSLNITLVVQSHYSLALYLKTFSWQNAKLTAGSKVKIDLTANQDNQYDWCRIKATTKHAIHHY